MALFASLLVWAAWIKLPVHYYSEIRSFIPSTELVLLGRSPYTQFQWNYGPLFLYIPVGLVRLSGGEMGIDSAYIIALIICTIAGLALLAYMATVLPARQRSLFFVLAALPFAFNITMGLNYTALRFAAPYAVLLWLHRIAEGKAGSEAASVPPALTGGIAWKLSLAFACGAIFCFAISPESGLGFFAAALLYFAALARNGPRQTVVRLAGCAAAGIVAAAVFFKGVSQEYLVSILGFGSGGGNFPVVPSPYILFYLGSLLLVVPALAAYGLRNRGANAALALSWALLTCIFIAPALGRSDPGHVFCNGLGVFLGGFFLLQESAPLRLRLYQGVFAFLFSAMLPFIALDHSAGPLSAVWNAYQRGERKCDRRFWRPAPSATRDREERFEAVMKPYASIGTPLGCDEEMEIYLKRTGRYVPEFFAPSAHNPITEKQAARKIAEIGTMPLILVPEDAVSDLNPGEYKKYYARWRGEFLSRLLLFPIPYRWSNRPLFAEFESALFVQRHFSTIGRVDDYLIMRRNE